MTVMLITALQAAETLAAYHRGRREQTLGAMRARHEQMHRRCLEDIDDIKWQLATSGVTAQNQTPARSRGAAARRQDDLKAQIAGEIYIALERLGADEELLAIVGSWQDTLNDAEVLSMLRDYNAGRPTPHRPQ